MKFKVNDVVRTRDGREVEILKIVHEDLDLPEAFPFIVYERGCRPRELKLSDLLPSKRVTDEWSFFLAHNMDRDELGADDPRAEAVVNVGVVR